MRGSRLTFAIEVAAALLAAGSVRAEGAAPTSLTSEDVLLMDTMGLDFTAALTVGRDGNVYGTTPTTIFRIDSAGVLTTVHTFSSEGMPARARAAAARDRAPGGSMK